jgi:PAS domain S-box-containing protein
MKPHARLHPVLKQPPGNDTMNDSFILAEAIIEQTSDAVIYADSSGTIARWNRAAESLFGYSANEAIGRSLDLIIPEHLRTAHWSGFELAIANGTTKLQGRATLTRAAHKSGRKLYVEMTFALVKGPDGKPLGSVAVARDVTERVERERVAQRGSTNGEHNQDVVKPTLHHSAKAEQEQQAMTYRRILVAIDGSRCAQLALDEALKIAQPSAALVRAVYVVQHAMPLEDLNVGSGEEPLLDEAGVRAGNDALARARRRFDELGLHGNTRLIDAHGETIAEALARAAKECEADLVVMGTHGRRGIRRVLVGSVAESFVKIAAVPVLLVRHGTDGSQTEVPT